MVRDNRQYTADDSFLPKKLALELAEKYGTPLFVYDQRTLEWQISRINWSFSRVPGFREYFPVRILNNPHLLRVIHHAGCGVQCCNGVELRLAYMAGIPGSDILYSSAFPTTEDWNMAVAYGATVILDHGEQLEELRLHEYADRVIGLRLSAEGQSCIPGKPPLSGHTKLGMPEPELMATIQRACSRGFRKFGLYMMPGNTGGAKGALGAVAGILLDLALRIYGEFGIRVEWCNIGGDLIWPTAQDDTMNVIEEESEYVCRQIAQFKQRGGWDGLSVFAEIGQYLSMPAGVLLTRVLNMKYQNIVCAGTDFSAAHLPKAVRNSTNYHVSKVTDYRRASREAVYLAGQLPESGDMFARIQLLPQLNTGDLLMIHDVGANGRVSSSNYCGTLRCPEVLLGEDGVKLIARRETFEDYIACLQRDDEQ